jgi:ribosomal protein S18 acetylase RimI-like enzyme
MTITVRRFAAHEWRMYRELRLRALSDAPDAFGSRYDWEAARSDSDWEDRLRISAAAETEMPLVAFFDGTPVGLAWGRQDAHDATLAHLFQVWVSPPFRGRGVGRFLTDAVIAWARDRGIRTLRLGVTASHPAARHLYERVGFVNAGEPEPLRLGSSVLSQPMQLVLASAHQASPPNER